MARIPGGVTWTPLVAQSICSEAPLNIIPQRLRNQRLIGRPYSKAEEVVGWLGAVQAQDFAGAKWALALRSRATNADIDDAFARGTILRTHVLRPTWHFVLPADVRWLLALTAPRVKAILATYDRRLDIDAKLLRRSHAVLAKALHGGAHLARTEIAAALARAGIKASGQRLGHLVMHAELDAVLCSGPLRGKQFTYALVAERAPNAVTLDRDAALGELARRFFASHGPATAHDFAWWSGLAIADAKRGAQIAAPESGEPSARMPPQPVVHLLPNYDEYLIAYKDRTPLLHPRMRARETSPRTSATFANVVLLNGVVVGTWRRTEKKGQIGVATQVAIRLPAPAKAALADAIERYRAFVQLPSQTVSARAARKAM